MTVGAANIPSGDVERDIAAIADEVDFILAGMVDPRQAASA